MLLLLGMIFQLKVFIPSLVPHFMAEVSNVFREQVFPIVCRGRDAAGNNPLREGIEVEVRVYQSLGSSSISSSVTCPHLTGSHGHRCKASHPPGVDKEGEGVLCPYAFDIPYALEKKKA